MTKQLNMKRVLKTLCTSVAAICAGYAAHAQNRMGIR